MSKKRKKKKNIKEEVHTPKRKFLLIFICIFAAIVVTFGAILGISSAIKKANAAVSYRGQIMSEEVASFFVAYYKNAYMTELRYDGAYPEDSPGFWNKDSGNGKTYGQILKDGTRDFVAQIIVTNYLFDKYATLTDEERDLIAEAAENTLNDKAYGSREEFDKAVAEFGFSYSSFKEATEMLYKAAMAENVFCGQNGENMKTQTALVNDYISEFSHVKLLFIRTETTYVLDENGKRETEEAGGAYKMRDLTSEEKEERALLISKIDSLIAAIGTGEDAMGVETFDYYVGKYDEGDESMHTLGYYFHPDSAFSTAYKENFDNITDKIYSMSVGDYGKAVEDFGVCYIYKYEPDAVHIEEDALENCFSDFYKNLAMKFFASSVEEFVGDVEFTDIFGNINVIDIPHNYDFIPVFG